MKFSLIKITLTIVGAKLSERAVYLAQKLFDFLYLGWWMQNQGFTIPQRSPDRASFYKAVAPKIEEPVSYLEFGVFQGWSIKQWSSILKNPESTLAGFDSFEGLPEDWNTMISRETFNVQGNIPKIDDSRVHFYKGWFSETLPGFLKDFTPKGTLVLHLDADLYSSTIYVLNQCRPFFEKGTVLIFDELFDGEHELKALKEFMAETDLELECIGATKTLTQVAFRILSIKPLLSPAEQHALAAAS